MSGPHGNVLVMAADYAALEARVTELEQQVRHVLPASINAVGYAVGLVHEDLRAFREETRAALAEILRRLPAEPPA